MSGTIDKNNPLNQLSARIVDIAFHVHQALGPGLFESVYEDILNYELEKSGLLVFRQKAIPIVWNDLVISRPAFKADLIIENKIIIELKPVDGLAPVHFKQVETYLRLTGLKLGLLINFNDAYFKDSIHRIVNRI